MSQQLKFILEGLVTEPPSDRRPIYGERIFMFNCKMCIGEDEKALERGDKVDGLIATLSFEFGPGKGIEIQLVAEDRWKTQPDRKRCGSMSTPAILIESDHAHDDDQQVCRVRMRAHRNYWVGNRMGVKPEAVTSRVTVTLGLRYS